jgi:hypothetical protein
LMKSLWYCLSSHSLSVLVYCYLFSCLYDVLQNHLIQGYLMSHSFKF